MNDFAFVDAHHHLWDHSQLHYAWLTDNVIHDHPIGDYSAIMGNYLMSDMVAEAKGCGLIKSVHLDAADGETDSVRETAWLQDVGETVGLPNAIIARVDLSADDAPAQLDRHMAYGNFRGVRMLSYMGRDFLDDPAFRRGFDALQARDLVYDMDANYQQFEQARDLAAAFPRATIVLGHCGFPRERTIEYFHAWRKGLTRLAEAPNVAVKLSGLGMSDHNWRVESIRPWIETCIESFGPSRAMFASNWPVDKLFSDYRTLIDAYRAIAAPFSADEQRQLFRSTAEGWYRI